MPKFQSDLKRMLKKTDISGLSIFGRGQSFDWEVLLSLFLIVVLCIVAYNIYVFLGVRAGDIFQTQQQSVVTSTLLNRKALDGVVNDFAARAQKLKDLETHRPVFVDPSL